MVYQRHDKDNNPLNTAEYLRHDKDCSERSPHENYVRHDKTCTQVTPQPTSTAEEDDFGNTYLNYDGDYIAN